MNSVKKKTNKDRIIVLIISVSLHAILFLILLLVEVRYNPGKSVSASFTALNITTGTYQKEVNKEARVRIKNRKSETKLKKQNAEVPNVKEELPSVIDSTSKHTVSDTSNKAIADTGLKYASTLLDTFLVRHPEYAKYILQQQAKDLVNDKNTKMFTRLEMETRINDVLHKYIMENFPEGSEHAMNPNGGPGMQIPIDGVIDAIKKIFK